MKPELHAFFLDPSASGHFLHAELSAAYRRAFEHAGDQHELIAYTDEFDFLLDEIREYLRDENAYPEYTGQLADLYSALRAIDFHRAQVSEQHFEIGQRLDEIHTLFADAYMRPGQPIDHNGYESWREARDRTLAEIESLRLDPYLVPHIDRVLTNLDELVNTVPTGVPFGDLPYFTTPVDRDLHAFFLDPSAFPDDRHPEISARYSALCAQLEGEDLELLAYTDGFRHFLNHIRVVEHYARDADPDNPYTAHLTRLRAATYAIFHRCTRVLDLNDTISHDLRIFRDMEHTAVRDGIPLTESHTHGPYLSEARAMIETAERYALFPLLTTHMERSLSSLPDLQNTVSAHTALAEQATTAANATPRNVNELAEAGRHRTDEQHFQTMTDTPENTWEKIKDDYRTLFEAAGNDVNAIAYQEGFDGLRDFGLKVFNAAHYPDQHEIRLVALLETLRIQHERASRVRELTKAGDAADTVMHRVREDANNPYHQPFTARKDFVELRFLRERFFTTLREIHADPDLTNHLPLVAESLNRQIASLADPDIPTVFHPDLEAERNASQFTPELHHVAWNYSRALRDAGDADLLPYSPCFNDLRTSIEDAIQATANDPLNRGALHLGPLFILQEQLSISSDRAETARTAIDDLAGASARLSALQAWSTAHHRPIHEAPDFAAWRDRADEVLDRCQRMRGHFQLGPHFQRGGLTKDAVDTALDVLRDTRFRKPASAREIAAQRQAHAAARADAGEESFSMSA